MSEVKAKGVALKSGVLYPLFSGNSGFYFVMMMDALTELDHVFWNSPVHCQDLFATSNVFYISLPEWNKVLKLSISKAKLIIIMAALYCTTVSTNMDIFQEAHVQKQEKKKGFCGSKFQHTYC